MKKLVVLLAMLMLVAGLASADLSIQMKRTNPGIAGEKSATLIFDVVNTDMEHKLEGFIWCQSPDDARVTASYGAGTGTGAQYVGPLFTMENGPYQKAMTITIEADSPGDKNSGCTFKYIPYIEEAATAGSTITEPFTEDAQLDTTTGKTVGGSYVITFKGYTAAVEAKAATETEPAVEAKPATVKIDVDGVSKDIEVEKEETVKDVKIKVTKADDKGADVTVTGNKVTKVEGTSVKKYQKMDGTYVTVKADKYYRELRLDKTVPFAPKSMSDPQCPEGKTHCTASEVIDVGGMKIPIWAIIVGALLVILLIAYLLGKTSRS
jgi:hypothetical protein